MDESYDSSFRFKERSPTADTTNDPDLSLSELSVPGQLSRPTQQPFSLLARPSQAPEPEPDLQSDEKEEQETEEENVDVGDPEAHAKDAVRDREERLRQDLFVLRKLNAGFATYTEALAETRSATERVSIQLKQTNALLDKYIDIVSKSEARSRLIFDERWLGADDDEATLERHEREEREKLQREAEERAEAARREREREEREERERQERAERERIEAEKRERLAVRAGYGGVRGVRGTRASTRARGTSGMPRPVSGVPARGRPASSTTGSGGRLSRPGSSASTRAPANSRTGIR